jgi:hypothetical protein
VTEPDGHGVRQFSYSDPDSDPDFVESVIPQSVDYQSIFPFDGESGAFFRLDLTSPFGYGFNLFRGGE